MKINREPFGNTDGQIVELFSLRNDHGMEVQITNYGGIITAIKVPNQQGQVADVVLGLDTLDDYLTKSRYFGALIGRYANRIARGRFCLNGRSYSLATNNGANHLHGGLKGFDKVVWQASEIGHGIQLRYLSED